MIAGWLNSHPAILYLRICLLYGSVQLETTEPTGRGVGLISMPPLPEAIAPFNVILPVTEVTFKPSLLFTVKLPQVSVNVEEVGVRG